MKSECALRVAQTLGRSLSAVESRDIETRLRLARRRLARQDPDGWQKLTAEEQTERAGAEAAREITRDAIAKRIRMAQTIVAHDRIENYIASQRAAGIDKDGMQSIDRLLESNPDGKNNIVSLHSAIQGIAAAASTYLTRSWHVAGGRFLKLLRDPRAEALLVRALHGDTSVPKAFQDAARDFHTLAERLRQRFNAAGGDVGKLDNWGMPHSWSLQKLLKAGKEAWTDTMLPLMDRDQYVHDDGSRYSDDEMRAFLGEAWQSVVTNGANKVLAGDRVGAGIKANRHSAERQIHLTGADAYLTAMRTFSDRGVMDAMFGHVRRMSRDIGLVEQFGPNADLAFRQALETETNRAIVAHPERASHWTSYSKRLTDRYNYEVNGSPMPSTWYAKAVQGWRNLNMLKLGATAINSLGDWGTMLTTAHVNGVPKTKMFLNELRALNPLDRSQRAIAASAGLMVREYSQTLARFGDELGAHGWTSKVGNTMLKVSLAPYVWRARQQAFSLGMMDQVGKAVAAHTSIDALNDDDQKLTKHFGLDDRDWQVMRLAKPDTWGGNHTLLTPESIYQIPDAQLEAAGIDNPQLAKDKAASNLMALVYSEQDRAILEPGPRIKVALGGMSDPDSAKGILLRSFSLFKTYSFDMTYQHLNRALKYYDSWKGSVGYLAALVAATTVCGATANAINDLIAGRDPRTLNLSAKEGWKNWIGAMVRGGGLGLYGDYLINTAGARGNTLAETLLGPLVSDASSLLDFGQKAIAASTDPDADTEKKLHSPAIEAERTVRSYIPGANLWYTRAVLDHLIFNDLSDYLSPGYMQRQQSRDRQQGHTHYWQPDQAFPDRAPDFSHIGASQN
ncbi:MAG TPA: hypothetical protein VFN69_04430 [Rudaea sp.]|nr:hypothetical protein [Rudaea sp.]